MTVNETAREGFGRDAAAAAYERSRPRYPEDAIAWLAQRLDLRPGTTVVDLAAGTGKLTRALVGTGAGVIAVEPVEPMLELLRRHVPEVDLRSGTAENTGLPHDCADAVTVAQAFHWFDGPAALAEIDRILRRRGKLALLWNVRDLDHSTQRAVEDLFARHRGSTPSHRSGEWRAAFATTARFKSVESARFPNVHMLDADALALRVESTSFVSKLPDAERQALLAEVRSPPELAEPFPFPYLTEIEIFD